MRLTPTAKANAAAIIRYPAKAAFERIYCVCRVREIHTFLFGLDEIDLIGFKEESSSVGIAPSTYRQELSD